MVARPAAGNADAVTVRLWATGKDYVRRSQERLLGQPIVQNLVAASGVGGAERRMLELLEGWRQREPAEQGYGPGDRNGRQQAGPNGTDPLGRPLRPHEAGDELSKMIPGEIDVQRVRRILEELRRRLADPSRPQIELDYIERLLKDY